MINILIGLLTMIVIGYLFNKGKSHITKNAISTLKNSPLAKNVKKKLGATIGKTFKPDGTVVVPREKFQFNKLQKVFELGDIVEWIKSLKEIGILDVKKWVIFLFIAGIIYGYGAYRARLNAPVQIPFDYPTEYKMKLNGHFLYKPANSNDLQIVDKHEKLIKDIKLKDFPAFAKKLRPIALEFKPILILGYGAGGNYSGREAGLGIRFARMWKWRMETYATNRGGYLGVSYKLTKNTSIGVGTGLGYHGEKRAEAGFRFEF